MSDSEAAKVGGIYDKLSNFVLRRPLVVIIAWCALAATLALVFPPLMEAGGKKNDAAALPADAPTMVTNRDMANTFSAPAIPTKTEPKKDDAGAATPAPKTDAPKADAPKTEPAKKAEAPKGDGSQLLIILTNEQGLGPTDLARYHTLVDKLHKANFNFQEFISVPQLRDVLASKDNKAWNIPVMFPTSQDDPATQAGYKQIRGIADETLAGSQLTAHYAGAVAIVDDMVTIGKEDTHLIEVGTAISVLVILLMVYRNIVTMLIPLATIGLSLGTAQGLLSGLTLIGLDVQMQTVVFMTAVMIGGGTDYAVFLISRYHDYIREGIDSDEAVKKAMMAIGKVIAASAATVAITFIAMVFAKLSVFASIGPAISISIAVAFVAAVTLLPAILVLIGRRGWIKPGKDLTHRMWRKSGIRIVRRPWIHLIASLIILAILAGSSTLVRFNYNDLKALPADVESVQGFAAMDRHFPQNMMTPMILFIKSPRDLRAPSALADMEQMAARISQLPDIIAIRGLTRPTGNTLEQTKVSYQAGEVGGKLDQVAGGIQDHVSELDKLTDGTHMLAGALAGIRDEINSSMGNMTELVSLLVTMKQLIGGDPTVNKLDDLSKMVGKMQALGNALTANTTDINNITVWAAPVLSALNSSPECKANPACVSSRSQLQTLSDAKSSGTLGSITALGNSLKQTKEIQDFATMITKVKTDLDNAVNLLRSIDGLQAKINQMQVGAAGLAQGSSIIDMAVTELVKQTKTMGSGLGQASDFLLQLKHDASKASMGGFNIPQQALATDEFKKGMQAFISPDGHGARYLVQSALPPFTTAAMDQVSDILTAARTAQPNSELSDATIAMVGIPTGLRDTRDYYQQDIKFIVISTVLIVFFILVVLLRAIVAPLYLIISVLVSFMSALGLGVIVFQLILGKDLHWSLPGLSFILLVAVGADYNMLFISRIRDESPNGVRIGVIRTVGSTGAVITSAGLIFAASMFGLLAASIATMVEAGFIIGSGILIDTFLVRTITVPALAALIGSANWWPSKLGQSSTQLRRVSRRTGKPKMTILERLKAVQARRTREAQMAALTTEWVNEQDPARELAMAGAGARRRLPATAVPHLFVDEDLDLEDYPLPLFGTRRDPRKLRIDGLAAGLGAPLNGIAADAKDVDAQSLPMFGPLGHNPTPVVLATRRNGTANGYAGAQTNGRSRVANGTDRTGIGSWLSHADDGDREALPLFGAIIGPHYFTEATWPDAPVSTHGDAHDDHRQDGEHALPVFGPTGAPLRR